MIRKRKDYTPRGRVRARRRDDLGTAKFTEGENDDGDGEQEKEKPDDMLQ